MHFDVAHGEGLGGNALKAGLEEARYRQTPSEHAELLDISTLPDYQTVINMPPGPAKTLAIAALKAEAEYREHEAPKYWNEEVPRRPVSQSDSWVAGIDYDPNSQFMMYHTDRHSYPRAGMTPDAVGDLVNAPSIGKRILGIG